MIQSRTAISQNSAKGFTLLEIIVAVMIIGVLATLAFPGFRKVRDASRISAVLNDIRIIEYALENFSLENGYLPPDTQPGVFPDELDGILPRSVFETPTQLGGVWDWDNHLNDPDPDSRIAGVTLVEVDHAPAIRENLVLKVEQKMGNRGLNEGRFRQIPQFHWGYITYVVEEGTLSD
ncbi:MAG: type II secretion system protein [Opitutales bacterium]|nr:type II secretion system protein [Opitutales bacterium]MCH8541106.1 type II secretion system GspH family protein [Opitutales bacterium]